jgi:Zn-dependent protease with chaperone function
VILYVIAALVVYAGVTGVLADRLLTRAGWTVTSPTLALRVWHTCALAFVSAVICASAVLAHDLWDHLMMWLFHAEESPIHAAYAGSAEVDPWWNATVGIALLLASALMVTGVRQFRDLHRTRAAHRLLDHRLAQHPGAAGVYVLPGSEPVAYCISGSRRDGRIVVTSGAVELLGEAQLRATIEHERAHLQYRHDRGILWSVIVSRALGRLGILRNYSDQVRRLSEMAADDHAATRVGPRLVATALLAVCRIAAMPHDAATLVATAGSRTAERIRRLWPPTRPRTVRRDGLLAAGAATALILLPFALVVVPAAAATG